MSIKETLLEDYKDSIKQKDTNKKNVVTMMRAAILQVEKDEHTLLEDEQILDIISKQVKQRKDSIEEFKKGAREDLVEKTNAELEYLYKFLPEQLTKQQLMQMVSEAIERLNITDMKQMGALMADIMPKIKGRADGKAVNAAVKEILTK